MAAAAIVVGGLAWSSYVYLTRRMAESQYEAYKSRIGRSLLLGLEVVVAADIVKTIAVAPTLPSLAVLAGLVLIRTFLSWTLEHAAQCEAAARGRQYDGEAPGDPGPAHLGRGNFGTARTMWADKRIGFPYGEGRCIGLGCSRCAEVPDEYQDSAAPRGRYYKSLTSKVSERSAAWLAHQSGGLGVGSSNLPAPTNSFNCQYFAEHEIGHEQHDARARTISTSVTMLTAIRNGVDSRV